MKIYAQREWKAGVVYGLQEVLEICYDNAEWNKKAIEVYGFLPFVFVSFGPFPE